MFINFTRQVWPITEYKIKEINEASNTLVEKHRTAFENEKLLKQVGYLFSGHQYSVREVI